MGWVTVGIAVLALGIASALLLRPKTEPLPTPPEPFMLEDGNTLAPSEEFPPASSDSAAEAEEPDEVKENGETKPQTEALPLRYVQVGRLIYETDGNRLAEETYRLTRGPEGVEIVSTGSFSAKFLLVRVTVNFSQEIRLDPDLRPRTYTLEARGPLGFGNRRVFVFVEGNEVKVIAGNAVQTLAMPSGNAFFLGTLAAYTILPALYEAWAVENGLVLAPVGTGGGPGAPFAAGEVEVIRLETVSMETAQGLLLLDRYRIRVGNFMGTLFARGLEFVAFLGEGARPFTVYRVDLFPHGIRLVP